MMSSWYEAQKLLLCHLKEDITFSNLKQIFHFLLLKYQSTLDIKRLSFQYWFPNLTTWHNIIWNNHQKTYALFHITFRYYFLYCQLDLGKWSRHVSQVFHINAILSQLESSRVLKDGENPIIATCFCLAATYIKSFPLAKLLNWVSSIFSKQ